METIARIFDSRTEAEQAVRQIHSLGIPNDRIALLTPGTSDAEVENRIPTTETEEPGEGRALGGAVGGAIGVAGGASLGAAAASLLIPGVGPVIAGGLLGAALLGAGGTVTGMAAGQALDQAMVEGLPRDEIYLYEHALRKGRSVVITFAEDHESAERVLEALGPAQADSVAEARESWWKDLRAGEEACYTGDGKDFQRDEASYRRGFEAALNTKVKDLPDTASAYKLDQFFDDAGADEAFRCGYRRGLEYQKRLLERYNR
jgi:hypothetical protein